MSTYTVSTERDNTGIAPGNHTWHAWFGDADQGNVYGHGYTEADAIADLFDNYDCPWEGT